MEGDATSAFAAGVCTFDPPGGTSGSNSLDEKYAHVLMPVESERDLMSEGRGLEIVQMAIPMP